MNTTLTSTLILLLFIVLQLSTVNTVELKFFRPPKPLLHKIEQPINSIDSLTIQTINILMDQQKIPNSNQYQNCFSQELLLQLDSKVQQGLEIGRQLQENGIENFPKIVNEFLAKNFDQNTLNCFFGSNDLRMLMLSYNVQTLSQAV